MIKQYIFFAVLFFSYSTSLSINGPFLSSKNEQNIFTAVNVAIFLIPPIIIMIKKYQKKSLQKKYQKKQLAEQGMLNSFRKENDHALFDTTELIPLHDFFNIAKNYELMKSEKAKAYYNTKVLVTRKIIDEFFNRKRAKKILQTLLPDKIEEIKNKLSRNEMSFLALYLIKSMKNATHLRYTVFNDRTLCGFKENELYVIPVTEDFKVTLAYLGDGITIHCYEKRFDKLHKFSCASYPYLESRSQNHFIEFGISSRENTLDFKFRDNIEKSPEVSKTFYSLDSYLPEQGPSEKNSLKAIEKKMELICKK